MLWRAQCLINRSSSFPGGQKGFQLLNSIDFKKLAKPMNEYKLNKLPIEIPYAHLWAQSITHLSRETINLAKLQVFTSCNTRKFYNPRKYLSIPHGEKTWFRQAIFIRFVFAQFFINFYENGNIQKLQDWSFGLLKNYFCRSNNERASRSQISITFFYTPCVFILH